LQNNDPIHVITISDERRREKPPDYDQVTSLPPSYDEALKLDPAALLSQTNIFQSPNGGATNNAFSLSSEATSRPSSSAFSNTVVVNILKTSGDKTEDEKNEPPPYTIAPS
jgi:hypothetical protein